MLRAHELTPLACEGRARDDRSRGADRRAWPGRARSHDSTARTGFLTARPDRLARTCRFQAARAAQRPRNVEHAILRRHAAGTGPIGHTSAGFVTQCPE